MSLRLPQIAVSDEPTFQSRPGSSSRTSSLHGKASCRIFANAVSENCHPMSSSCRTNCLCSGVHKNLDGFIPSSLVKPLYRVYIMLPPWRFEITYSIRATGRSEVRILCTPVIRAREDWRLLTLPLGGDAPVLFSEQYFFHLRTCLLTFDSADSAGNEPGGGTNISRNFLCFHNVLPFCR